MIETGRKDDENIETGKAAQSLVPVGTWNLKFSATKKESELKSFKTPLGKVGNRYDKTGQFQEIRNWWSILKVSTQDTLLR